MKPNTKELKLVKFEAEGHPALFKCVSCGWRGEVVAARKTGEKNGEKDLIDVFCPDCLEEAQYIYNN